MFLVAYAKSEEGALPRKLRFFWKSRGFTVSDCPWVPGVQENNNLRQEKLGATGSGPRSVYYCTDGAPDVDCADAEFDFPNSQTLDGQ